MIYMLDRNDLKNVIIVILTIVLILFIIYHNPLTYCNTENCIILGGDTQTQIINYVKLRLPELWKPLANYGSNPLHPLPGVILFSLLVKLFWFLTRGSMVLTFYAIESVLLFIGSMGFYLFLKDVKKGSLKVRELLAPLLLYILNPGLWVNLYHGLVEYLLSYALLPWILLEIRRTLLLLKDTDLPILKLIRNVIVIVVLVLSSLSHPIASSLTMLVVIGYSILLTTYTLLKEVNIYREALFRLTLMVFLSIVLLIPFILTMKIYEDLIAPSPNYSRLILETHREIKHVLSWHALTPLNVLIFYDNSFLQLGSFSIIYSLAFAGILFLALFKLSVRNRFRYEMVTWLLLFLLFSSLSMGSNAPTPFNTINELIYQYIPLARIVGYAFRFGMVSGFCMAMIAGLATLNHSNKEKELSAGKWKARFRYLARRKTLSTIITLTLVFTILYTAQLSSLIFTLKVPEHYYESASFLNAHPSYVYVVPSSEWVIPIKLELTRNATARSWPHNLLGYILQLNDVPETMGSYLKPYIEYSIKNNLTDLLSILFHYMGINYIAVDNYVKPTVPWLNNEEFILEKQLAVIPFTRFGDIKLFKINIPTANNTLLENRLFYIYDNYGIVATNILKFLPLTLIDKSVLSSYPIMIDEVNLPYISKLVGNADYIVFDIAGFYDLVLSYLYHYPQTRIMNAFDLAKKGICNGSCRIEAVRAGWDYTGKPYYSIFDGVMQIGKGSSYAITINTNKKNNYVVLVRILAKGPGGYIEVNGVSKKVIRNVENPDLYEPVWIEFDVKGANKISIRVEAMNNLYIDCIVIAPYKDYIDALNKVRAELNEKRVFIVFTPYDLKADRLRNVRMFGLGSIAQGNIALPTSWNNITKNSSSIYLLLPYNGVVKALGNASLVTEINLFKRYKVVEYKTVSQNVSFFVPYAELGVNNYRLLGNGTLELIGFGNYLWRLLPNQSDFRFLVLNFSISDEGYHVGNAFGLAFFHSSISGYEVKFTLKSRVNSSEVYGISLIERINGTPKIKRSFTIVLPAKKPYHNVTAYVDLATKKVLVLIDGIPCTELRANVGYGELFGLIQWGENARMLVKSATAFFTNTINISYTLYNITMSGYGGKLFPILISEHQQIYKDMEIEVRSVGRYSAFGIALYHDGRNGLEIKIPISQKGIISRIELWKRVNSKPSLIKTMVLKNPVESSALKDLNMELIVERNRDSINLIIRVANNTVKNLLNLEELEPNDLKPYVGLITWGQETRITINKFSIAASLRANNYRLNKDYNINLLTIKPSNGVALVVLESNPYGYMEATKANNESTSTIVFFQSYRKGWKVVINSSEHVKYVHLRGLYGISNIYIMSSSIRNVKPHFYASLYIKAEIAMYMLYIALYFLLNFLTKVRELDQ